MASLAAALLPPDMPADARRIEAALRAAPHRGAFEAIATVGSAAIGTSRHDERDGASVASRDGWAAGVAGVIDNRVDVARAVQAAGVAFDDTSPADLVLAGYRALGHRLWPELRGAYAIAISDGRRLWCVRDQLGSGPLFYRRDAGTTYVANEAKQVVAAAGLTAEPDLTTLEAIYYGYRDDDLPSALKGVTRLPKASLLTASDDGIRVTRYWDPTPLLESLDVSGDELREHFDALMRRAVDRVFRGDDVLALSGGIDSPTLAVYASDGYRSRFGVPLPVLSQVYPDYPSVDERSFIEEIVDRLGLELHVYQPPGEAQTLGPLDRWTRLTDGPWMGAWEPGVDEDRHIRLRSMGRRNYLTGDFAEYEMAFPFRLVNHLIWTGRLRPLLWQLRSQRQRGIRRVRIARQLLSAFAPAAAYRIYRSVRRNPWFPVPAWVDPKLVIATTPVERLPPWKRWSHQQLAGFHGTGLPFEAFHILNEADRVTVRWPWADVDVWEFFVSLRAEVKFPGAEPKLLMRQLMRGRLPDSVLNRRDNTVSDEFAKRNFDYASLERWIGQGEYRMPGIDYARLRARLGQRNLAIYEYAAAKDLAQVHAFLSNWSSGRQRDTLGES